MPIKKVLAVVVMEPIAVVALPIRRKKLRKSGRCAGAINSRGMALRWSGIILKFQLLSGMSNMKQVIENVGYAEHSQTHNLTADEPGIVGRAGTPIFRWGRVLYRL